MKKLIFPICVILYSSFFFLGTKKITEQTNAHKEVELNNRNKVIDTLKSRINYLHYEIGDQSDKIDDLEWRIDDLESNN